MENDLLGSARRRSTGCLQRFPHSSNGRGSLIVLLAQTRSPTFMIALPHMSLNAIDRS
jgi:hypothetical protein